MDAPTIRAIRLHLITRNFMSRKLALVATAVVAGYSAPTLAYEFGPSSMFSLNGFGTLGAVHSNLDLADFSSSTFQPDGAGYNDKRSPEVDSVLGLQGTATYGKWTAVVQGVTRQTLYDNYRPTIDWLNVRYQFNDSFSARVGRFAMPTYLFSDTRLVHYAMTAVRPSVEVYRLLPVTTADGVDLRTSTRRARCRTRHEPSGARTTRTSRTMSTARTRASGACSTTWSTATSPCTWRIRSASSNSSRRPSAFSLFRIADIGVNYDNGKWFVMAEVARTWLRAQLSPSSLAYVINPGVRFGEKFTPYVQYAKLDPRPDVLDNGVTRSPAASTQSAGVRWDFRPNFALKAQYDHSEAENGSNGGFINARPGFPANSSGDMTTVSLDFVF